MGDQTSTMTRPATEAHIPRQSGAVEKYPGGAARKAVDQWAEQNSWTPLPRLYFTTKPGPYPKAEKKPEGTELNPRVEWWAHAALFVVALVFSAAFLILQCAVWILAETAQWLAGHPLRLIVVGGALTAAGWFAVTHYLG